MKFLAAFLILLCAACAVSAFAALWMGDTGKALGFAFGALTSQLLAGLAAIAPE